MEALEAGEALLWHVALFILQWRLVKHHDGKLRQTSDKHELRRFLLLVLRNYIWPCLREFWWSGLQAGLLALVISYFTEVLIMAFSVDLTQFGISTTASSFRSWFGRLQWASLRTLASVSTQSPPSAARTLIHAKNK